MATCPAFLERFQDSVRYFLEELNDLLLGQLDGWKCDVRDFELASSRHADTEDSFSLKSRELRVYPRGWSYSSFLMASFVPNQGRRALSDEWIQCEGRINAAHIPFRGSSNGFQARFDIVYPLGFGETWHLRPVNDQTACYAFLRKLCDARYNRAQ